MKMFKYIFAAVFFASGGAAVQAGGVTSSSNATSSAMVEFAKQYAGETINFQIEGGLQPLSWRQDLIPIWEAATGVKINVIEVPFTEQFQSLIAASMAPGSIDAAYVFYNWLPDVVEGGALYDFESLRDKMLNTPEMQAELEDFSAAGVLAVSSWNDKQWGFPVDSAGLTNYYRTDIIENAADQAKFKDRYGYDLAAPKTWKQYGEIATYIKDEYAPDIYGALHAAGGGQAYFWFFQAFNSAEFCDGNYFDDDMNALVNAPCAVEMLESLKGFLDAGPPGANTIDPGRVWTDFIEGKLGMSIEFSPFARWGSPGDTGFSDALSFVPISTVEGKFKLAVPPGGNSNVIGYTTAISATSEKPELTFAFLAWATAPDMFYINASPPYSLTKWTVRYSTMEAMKDAYLNADQHMDAFKATFDVLTMEPKWFAAQEYLSIIDQAATSAYTGTPVQEALDTAAERWDAITKRVGKKNQKRAYAQYQAQMATLRGN
jgi:multiple sugar transport system substrate-binding protein